MARPRLTLYHYPSCPYCMMVRRAIGELGIEVELKNIHEQRGYLGELLEATGRRTVPVLKIEDEAGRARWMPESRDIIAYLRTLG